MSKESAAVNEAPRFPAVTSTRIVATDPDVKRQEIDVSEIQSLASQAVRPCLAPKLSRWVPSKPPATVTLTDPVPGALDGSTLDSTVP
eukprot:1060477-Rhodomonas_salina.2